MRMRSLSFRIPLISTSLTLASVAGTILVAIIVGKGAIFEMEENKTLAIAGRTAASLAELTEEIQTDGTLMAEMGSTVEAMKAFDAAFRSATDASVKLKEAYIDENQNPTGKKHLLDRAVSDLPVYDEVHARFHPVFRNVNEKWGYYDIFLINTAGDVVYTNFKENDFADNLITGPLKGEGLGEVFAEVMKTGKPHGTNMLPYSPSNGAAAVFWGHPIKEASGRIVGVFALQVPTEKIEGILNNYISEGGTSEAYLINEKGEYLTQPRRSQEPLVLTEVQDGIATDAPANLPLHVEDRLGNSVVATRVPVDFYDHDWSLIYKVDESEVSGYINSIIVYLIQAALAMSAVAAFLAQLFARSIVSPIRSINEITTQLATGARHLQIEEAKRDDEIGSIGRSLKQFQNALRDGDAAQAANAEAQAAKELAQAQMKVEIESFFRDRERISSEIERKIVEISNFSRDLADATRKVSTNVEVIEAGSSMTMDTMNTVASAAEELSASIADINQRTIVSRDQIQSTEALVSRINQDISHLQTYVSGISEIATLIAGIASKTNLLALNATIESARAGQSGKGFAVVASEVKELSGQTSVATHDIATKIDEVRNATTVSVETITSITENFGVLKTELMNIIHSVSTQAQATEEIAKSAAQANGQARVNSSSIIEVAAMVNQSAKGSEVVMRETRDLVELLASLEQRTASFFRVIRA